MGRPSLRILLAACLVSVLELSMRSSEYALVRQTRVGGIRFKRCRDLPRQTSGQCRVGIAAAAAWEPRTLVPDDDSSKYQLHSGVAMPRVGFGTYKIQPGFAYEAVKASLEKGYRMFDTAQAYQNEVDVGRAIKESGIPRDKVFVATKVWDDSHGYGACLHAGAESVRRLGLGYVDLLLMHSPGQKMVETYDALLELQRQGLSRATGVANFGVRHLEALREAGRPAPCVNQIEMHPVIFPERRELVAYCEQHGILVQAYGSMLAGLQRALAHPVLRKVAAAHGRNPNQILLRWGLDRGFQVIPKSVNPDRMAENFNILDFSLSQDESELLETQLSSDIGSLGVYWNPVDEAPVDLGNFSDEYTVSPPGISEGVDLPASNGEISSEGQARESVPGLRDWLWSRGLDRHFDAVNIWCDEVGAATFAEVAENTVDLAEFLSQDLSENEREVLLRGTH